MEFEVVPVEIDDSYMYSYIIKKNIINKPIGEGKLLIEKAKKCLDLRHILDGFSSDVLVGDIINFYPNGNVPQNKYATKDSWGEGMGTLLYDNMLKVCKNHGVKLIKSTTKEKEMASFLVKRGFKSYEDINRFNIFYKNLD